MSENITHDFVKKRALAFLEQFKGLPKREDAYEWFPPRDLTIKHMAVDVAKFHRLVLEKFPECSSMIETEVPSNDHLNSLIEMAREHYVENTLRSIIVAMDSKHSEETTSSSNVIEYEITNPNNVIENLFLRFHEVVKQLLARHDERETLEIDDEYDVQDLLHSLLKLYFDDIRPEEWNPSYAGSSTKVDFLILDNNIVIECKKTRKGLGNKELKEELIIDKVQYQRNSKCKLLYCFIYDPEERITNPRGFEKDLSENGDEFECKVFVVPRH